MIHLNYFSAMEEMVIMNAKIGSRSYKIKVEMKNEKYVRDTLSGIQNKMVQFKTQFPGMEEQDYLSMTLLDHLTSTANQAVSFQENELLNRLENISKLLDAKSE